MADARTSVYLDHSATTPTLEVVAQCMLAQMREGYANPSASYAPALAVEQMMNRCRDVLRDAVDAKGYDVIFTSGGTEADNMAVLGIANVQREPRVFCCSAVEHSAVSESMQAAQAMGHTLQVLPVTASGALDLKKTEALLDERVAFISCMHVNNETGVVQPIEELAMLRDRLCPKALLHVDGVQGFLRVPIRLARLGIDAYTLSAHKIHGPKGIGALLLRKGIRLGPILHGGGQENALRAGTENSPGIAGLCAAVEALRGIPDLACALRAMKVHLCDMLMRGDSAICVNGPNPASDGSAPHIVNLAFPGIRGEVLLHALESEQIYVSTGSACSARRQKHSPVLLAMGLTGDRLEGAIRVSLSPLNTMAEMDRAAEAMLAAYTRFKGLRRR